MANVVIVGGGFAGLSAAARLAKLRHRVTVLESADRLGGRLHGVTRGGRTWPLDLDTVTLPGVFRDLFRKSGRPLERVLELSMTPGRRHVFNDGSVLDLPLGTRGGQHRAVMDLLGDDEWSPWVDSLADQWDLVRRTALDQLLPARATIGRSTRRSLRVRRSLATLAERDLHDDRLRKLVLDPVRLAGQDRRATPALVGGGHYVERTFGRWRFAGGLPALAAALETRLDERGVAVELDEHAHELVLESGSVRGVVTSRRTLTADIVVWCAPTWPSPLAPVRLMPVIPASRTLLELSAGAPDLADEILVHANPPIRLWAGGNGHWTIEHRSGEDPLRALARFGMDLRPFVIEQISLNPSELVGLGHWGWTWRGWASVFDQPGAGTTDNLFFAGAHAHPGATLEAIGMATASIAEAIGPAPRP